MFGGHLRGIAGALENHAESVFGDLTGTDQDVCKEILLSLTQLGDGLLDRKQRMPRRDLGDSEATARVLDRLIDERLVTSQDEYVEIAHEELLRKWPCLNEWIRAEAPRLETQRRLAIAAREWRKQDEDKESYLYRGAQLAAVETWLVDHASRLTPVMAEFIQASIAANRRALQREIERNQRLEKSLTKAEAEALRARDATRMAAVSAERDRDSTAVLTLLREVETSEPFFDLPGWPETVAQIRSPWLSHSLQGHSQPVNSVAFSPDRKCLVTTSSDTTARAWQQNDDGFRLLSHSLQGHTKQVVSAALSPNGNRIVTASRDGTARVAAE
ncbi:MAG: hypothetical protein MJE77_13545 [Proteobacteria bacterium]|nr:hypothetical protein [Pseudomonadota bacterium]